tara:strand:+ start:1137 stop:1919 length:783 start_codon:yes stop_codon:yes gene_type:complete
MKNINIKPVNHGTTRADKNRYCGPSVISAVTGMTTGEAARLIRHVGGRKSVKGSYVSEVTNALAMCGIKSTYKSFDLKLSRSKGPTLAAWLRHTVKERTAKRVFLIVAGHHFQLVQGRRYVCGILGEPVSIRHKRVKRRARVSNVFELSSLGTIQIPAEARKPKRDAVVSSGYGYAKVKRLAKKMEIEIELEQIGPSRQYDIQKWISYDDVDENNEHLDFAHMGVIDGHCSYDWCEVLWKLEEIQEYRNKHGYRRYKEAA